MEIEKHHDRLREEDSSNSKSWSELPPDLLDLVFKRLTFANFHRAKSVCSSWLSSSKQSMPRNNHTPWLILFPKDAENNSCRLFNPEEKDKLYKQTREDEDLRSEFAKSFCIATFGNWLLMRDPLYTLSIVNLFTNEIITLPPVESQLGTTKIDRISFDNIEFRITSDKGKKYERRGLRFQSPLLWIDEKTRDYIVLWGILERYCKGCVVYSRNGDNSWNQIPETPDCCDMVYKDSKLYFLSSSRSFIIFDFFSGGMMMTPPQVSFQSFVSVDLYRSLRISVNIVATMIVVTVSGEVLKVEKLWGRLAGWSFRVYKAYSSSGLFERRKVIDSLGDDDEAMLLDQGITVLADDANGFVRNSIYFSVSRHNHSHETFYVFNLETKKTEPLHKFDSSSSVDQFSRGRWLFPNFTESKQVTGREVL
ncbi:unnamed protein product [Microthlaspi erraticum]|uniref:F-box domain-containing protein n=1 Tax=Microthlaspi erraticum TaxID=1685480 RepID=A0A6D2K3P9_9BRAS|nr:unnamed protein product [Microthlaspi erraticum]